MFMPYIESPKMDWTVNDGLYHRFLKWHLKCENILECKLVALPECQKCKKVIAWCYVMQPMVSVSCLGDKSLLHAKLMSTALTQLLIFRFSCLLTNKGIVQCIDN